MHLIECGGYYLWHKVFNRIVLAFNVANILAAYLAMLIAKEWREIAVNATEHSAVDIAPHGLGKSLKRC